MLDNLGPVTNFDIFRLLESSLAGERTTSEGKSGHLLDKRGGFHLEFARITPWWYVENLKIPEGRTCAGGARVNSKQYENLQF